MASPSGLPEDIHYQDTGCKVAPRCLQCPLPLCRYDQPPPPPHVRRSRARQDEVIALTNAGHSTEQIVAALNISRRTVFRLRARPRLKTGD